MATLDDKQFKKNINLLKGLIEKTINAAVFGIGQEILRIGMTGPPPQVPHNKGILQGTGHTLPASGGKTTVGYNTVYAARLHEHPEYKFKKGRKGKYLEDPIKNNYGIFRKFITDTYASIVRN